MRQRRAIGESPYAAVLEKAADDRFDPDRLRQPAQAGAQAADSAHDKFDRHPRPARLVKLVDNVGVDEAVHLGPHPRRAPGARRRNLRVDKIADAIPHVERRYGHHFMPLGLDIARSEENKSSLQSLMHISYAVFYS